VKYQRLALTAITSVTAVMLATPTASASAIATAPAKAAGTSALYETYTIIRASPWQKKESWWGDLRVMETGKVKISLEDKQYKRGVGLRLISCKGKKALTDWKQMKKKVDPSHPGWYTLNRVFKKNTCFRVQSGRSWAGTIGVGVRNALYKSDSR
jgi:hypothetical protein